MLLWIIQWIFISLILIILLHYLYLFFKNTLTIPKVRDLVNKPTETYNEIMHTINAKQNDTVYNTSSINREQLHDNTMQDELKNFLNELKKPKSDKQPDNISNNISNNFNSYNNSSSNTNTNNMFEAANDLSYSSAFSSY